VQIREGEIERDRSLLFAPCISSWNLKSSFSFYERNKYVLFFSLQYLCADTNKTDEIYTRPSKSLKGHTLHSSNLYNGVIKAEE
jgi:hypothetical protein